LLVTNASGSYGEQPQKAKNMDLIFRLIQAKDFLKASPLGEYNLEMTKQLLLKLALENSAPRQYDVLIDVRGASGRLSFADIIELVQMMIENRDSFRSKLAILASPGHQFGNAKFMELYAGNRGFRVRAFVDFEETLYWLVAGSVETPEAELRQN
jgi:hypothetical protein